MANQPGSNPPPRFRSGQVLRAEDLNRIVEMLARRILGGRGVRIRTFGNRIIIDRDPPSHRTVNQ